MSKKRISALRKSVSLMEEQVTKKVADTRNEIRMLSKRLTWQDSLITDSMLLQVPPDALKSALTESDYKDFVENNPDYLHKFPTANNVEIAFPEEEERIASGDEPPLITKIIDTVPSSKQSITWPPLPKEDTFPIALTHVEHADSNEKGNEGVIAIKKDNNDEYEYVETHNVAKLVIGGLFIIGLIAFIYLKLTGKV